MNKRFLALLVACAILAGAGLVSGARAVAVPAQSQEYTMLTYAPTADIQIQYPRFTGAQDGALNALVLDFVKHLLRDDLDLSAVTADYQAAVTLHNAKIVSIVVWGDSNVEGSIHPFSDLNTLNIDLDTLTALTLEDLYTVSDAFADVLFAKGVFPTDPVTAYTADTFAYTFQSLAEMYQTIGIGGSQPFFLKPDGIVISLPSIHASGSDHLEAELRYEDIQSFYRPSQNYWED